MRTVFRGYSLKCCIILGSSHTSYMHQWNDDVLFMKIPGPHTISRTTGSKHRLDCTHSWTTGPIDFFTHFDVFVSTVIILLFFSFENVPLKINLRHHRMSSALYRCVMCGLILENKMMVHFELFASNTISIILLSTIVDSSR